MNTIKEEKKSGDKGGADSRLSQLYEGFEAQKKARKGDPYLLYDDKRRRCGGCGYKAWREAQITA